MAVKDNYNIYDLYIVETLEDGYHFICEYDLVKDEYIEVFTNSKIEDIKDITLFANYYYKSLKLSKEELLKKYIEVNDISLKNNFNNFVDKVLDSASIRFFPDDGSWYSSCYKKPMTLDKKYLPCHLNDDVWLANMIIKDQKLLVSTNAVLRYVKTSPFFKKIKHDYSIEIVKWQINWMLHDGDGWIQDKNYGGELMSLSPLYDIGFRSCIVETLSKIGLDKEIIEEGLEANASLWRDKVMEVAFNNQYNPNMHILSTFYTNSVSEQSSDLNMPTEEFKSEWIKLRKYEYYKKHKDSVTKYGKVENDMMMSEEESLKTKSNIIQEEKKMKEALSSKNTKVKKMIWKRN